MITSNINEILLKNEITESNNNVNSSNDFLNTLTSTKIENSSDITRDNSLTYSNIKGISLEEIDTLFEDEESRNMAKNLRLATLFTEDETLGQALFNTVMGEPFELGYSYLYDRYEDKNSFFNTDSSLAELLHSSISNKLDTGNKKTSDVISQDRLDEILTTVNSFNFVSALSTTSKDQYGKYKDDEDNDYSFLYNDYALKYQELIYKYEEIDLYNKNIIKQF
ncbi:hypothetical protein LPB137_06945 [Poseidonibacter parvus]|uniref:Uncharacterized protein n=1 Tax=Poseidonibacter parvus TaxID=1850254 RepID=A0A1P8KM32_9BACT|nr:hypothetical protein [Poseidonibacter parvus]APW65602.1 hypothetical protein LPB137_06945 [Poseidonibacter parvus]